MAASDNVSDGAGTNGSDGPKHAATNGDVVDKQQVTSTSNGIGSSNSDASDAAESTKVDATAESKKDADEDAASSSDSDEDEDEDEAKNKKKSSKKKSSKKDKSTKTQKKDDAPALPIGSLPHAKYLQERFSASGDAETVEVTHLHTPYGGADAAYALVARQIYSEKNRLEGTRVAINSPHILRALREVVGTYPTLAVDFTERFEIEEEKKEEGKEGRPGGGKQLLFHYWDELEAYRDGLAEGPEGEDEAAKKEREEAHAHLNVLVAYMEHDLAAERRIQQAMLKKGQIDFARLWLLYRPGDLVVSFVKGHAWLMRVTKSVYDEDPKCGKFLRLHATYTDYDGTEFGVQRHEAKLLQRALFGQANPTDVTELPVFPVRFWLAGTGETQEEMEARLRARGDKFLGLAGVAVKQYDGLADHLKSSPPNWFDPEMDTFALVWLPFTESGRVVIDRKTFQEDHYQGGVAKLATISAEDRLLCPPFAYGFSVARKEWCRYFLDTLTETTWKKDAFDSLILPEKQLGLVKALVSSHSFPDNARDQVEQKGKGLVALLHGPPGSGKTLTAECAAEETQRALFSTSMSELNRYNDAYWFENELKQVLRLATIWKAVVLFDEADVFLEARGGSDGTSSSTGTSTDNATRNALVAVFLRHLEYFSGIVFLTTNRIHVFDAAMKSRVHVALGYAAPSAASRRRIWTTTLAKVPAAECDTEVLEDAATLDALAARDLNGREIANTITTARTLARFARVPMGRAHIENVLGVRIEFEENLQKLRRGGGDVES